MNSVVCYRGSDLLDAARMGLLAAAVGPCSRAARAGACCHARDVPARPSPALLLPPRPAPERQYRPVARVWCLFHVCLPPDCH